MPTITIRVTEQERAALDAAASREGVKLSEYVRQTLALREDDIGSRVLSLLARYQLTPAWHVVDTHDRSEPGTGGREIAVATSKADGEEVVRALYGAEGAVEERDEALRLLDQARPDLVDPNLRRSWARRYKALRARVGGQ